MANTTAISTEGGVHEIVCGSGVNHVAISCCEFGGNQDSASLNEALKFYTGVRVRFDWDGFYYKIYRWVDGTDTSPNNDVEVENNNPGLQAYGFLYVPKGCYLKLIVANVSRRCKVEPYV